ncbi:hypothetical protein KY289_032507 [Solanum tuberosum]|nr:hypothetical protein KY289_032507 [Solanum tuberosum]
MASMVFTSSPFSVQSFVKLRTNSNYPHPSCYVPRGDNNFSIASPKFPRVASTYSPSLNIIKASRDENIYHYPAYEGGDPTGFALGDRYRGMVLLIVNIPQMGSIWAETEIKFLNDLRKLYEGKISSPFKKGFEVLGFFYDMENHHGIKSWFGLENHEIEAEKERIRRLANFPIFDKVEVNDDHHENLYRFMRTSRDIPKIGEEFEKFLIDGNGIPVKHFIRFDGETLEPQPVRPGEYPGESFTSEETNIIKATIDKFHWKTQSQ